MLVKEIMTQNIITIDAAEPVSKASDLMRQYDIGILPVVENGKVAGVVTDRDIVIRAISQNRNIALPVSEIMSKSTICANPKQEVSAAAKTMAAQQIRRVPVMENGELCGILSLCDISKNGYDAEVSAALCEISKP